jgi:hypothetical protein
MSATITSLPTTWAALEAALRERRPVRVCYHAKERLICPHALGWKSGRAMLLAYQSGGHTTAGALDPDPRKRWRCLLVEEIAEVLPADPASSWQSGDNYDRHRPFPAIDEIAVAIT